LVHIWCRWRAWPQSPKSSQMPECRVASLSSAARACPSRC
jgi:hypothetical protein